MRITDFAPRFQNFGRMFRAAAAHPHHRAGRRAAAHHHPVAPDARLRRTDDRVARSAATTSAIAGGNTALRLTTDAPLSYIDREASFVLTRPVHLVFGTDKPFAGELEADLPRIRRPHRAIIGSNGCAA